LRGTDDYRKEGCFRGGQGRPTGIRMRSLPRRGGGRWETIGFRVQLTLSGVAASLSTFESRAHSPCLGQLGLNKQRSGFISAGPGPSIPLPPPLHPRVQRGIMDHAQQRARSGVEIRVEGHIATTRQGWRAHRGHEPKPSLSPRPLPRCPSVHGAWLPSTRGRESEP